MFPCWNEKEKWTGVKLKRIAHTLDINLLKNEYGHFEDLNNEYGHFEDLNNEYGHFEDLNNEYGHFEDDSGRTTVPEQELYCHRQAELTIFLYKSRFGVDEGWSRPRFWKVF